jgi:hypothetical protein
MASILNYHKLRCSIGLHSSLLHAVMGRRVRDRGALDGYMDGLEESGLTGLASQSL